jgi:predicted amidohydrolase
MKVAVIQLAYDDTETVAERTDRVVGLVRAQAGHDLVVLPELWAMGGFDYRAWDAKAETVDGSVRQAISAVAAEIGAMVHAGSIVERPGEPGPEGKHLWNTSIVVDAQGEPVATYRKIHRFGFAVGEPALMEAGDEQAYVDLPGGQRAGLSTCYDLRFPELYRAQVDAGATAFVIPAAWPMARVEHWRLLLRARAIEDQCLVIACNTAGTHAKTEMGGHSAIIGPWGDVLAEARAGEEVLSVEVADDLVAQARETFPVLADRRL